LYAFIFLLIPKSMGDNLLSRKYKNRPGCGCLSQIELYANQEIEICSIWKRICQTIAQT